ncbi:MAG: helix-turn-helix domain containing protein [Anaerolineales bacterium]
MSIKRDQLIKTGEALFIKYGMRRVTVEEICREANVSKPTFYKYFKNKEDLARRIDEIWVEEALQKVEEIEESEMAFPEKLMQILEVKQEITAKPGPEFLNDLMNLDIDVSHAYKRVMHFFINSQRERNLREEFRPEFLLAAFTVLNNMQYDPKIRALYDDAEILAGDIFKLFYYGALSPEHRETSLPKNGK